MSKHSNKPSCFMCEHSVARYHAATDGNMEVKCSLTGESHSCEVPSCDNQFTIVSFGKIKEKK